MVRAMQIRNLPYRPAGPDTRRHTSRCLAVSMLTTALVGIGCASVPPSDTGEIPQLPTDPAGVTNPEVGEKARADTATGAGLQPLPTPQQVIGAVPLGRRDPFAQLIPSFSPSSPGPGSPGPGGQPVMRESDRAAKAPPSSVSPSGTPPLQLPQDFSITGVIRSGGITEAVVIYGDRSGSLRVGDRGGRSTDLLPSGWSVAAVDVNQGLLTLQKDGRRVQARL